MSLQMQIWLLVLASASPLLTYTKLWQVKEWRIDRLKEHLRANGSFKQLFGTVRPIIVLGGLALILFGSDPSAAADMTLMVLTVASLGSIIAKRQKYPVWTGKACILAATTLALTLLVGLLGATASSFLFPLLIVSQPLLLYVAWLCFRPIDTHMKQQIMEQAEKLLASYENTLVIGITGSVGKTTVKEFIAHTLAGNQVLFTPAYINSDMGVSKWLLKELPKHKKDERLILIVEMGAYKKGEISLLCKICKPRIGIITYIGTQHLALFGSQEKLAEAKSELFAALPENGRAFYNADCELCHTIKDQAKCPVTTVGTAGQVDLEAFDIEEQSDGVHFRVADTAFLCPMFGTHNVVNVLLMISVCQALGISLEDIAQRLRSFSPPHSTFAVRKERSVVLLDDTHNASPESFRAAIAWAKSVPFTPRTLITPGLIELGQKDSQIHRNLGTLAAGIFDRVIFTGSNGKDAFEEGFGKPVEQYKNPINTVPKNSLLACIGRVSKKQIDHLLP